MNHSHNTYSYIPTDAFVQEFLKIAKLEIRRKEYQDGKRTANGEKSTKDAYFFMPIEIPTPFPQVKTFSIALTNSADNGYKYLIRVALEIPDTIGILGKKRLSIYPPIGIVKKYTLGRILKEWQLLANSHSFEKEKSLQELSQELRMIIIAVLDTLKNILELKDHTTLRITPNIYKEMLYAGAVDDIINKELSRLRAKKWRDKIQLPQQQVEPKKIILRGESNDIAQKVTWQVTKNILRDLFSDTYPKARRPKEKASKKTLRK